MNWTVKGIQKEKMNQVFQELLLLKDEIFDLLHFHWLKYRSLKMTELHVQVRKILIVYINSMTSVACCIVL